MANPTPESPAGKTPPPPPRKPSLAQALFKILKDPDPADSDPQKVVIPRRRFVIASALGVLGVNFLVFLRFFFPRALYEPKTRFRLGFPSDFGFGVDTKFQNQYRSEERRVGKEWRS